MKIIAAIVIGVLVGLAVPATADGGLNDFRLNIIIERLDTIIALLRRMPH